MGVTIRDVAKLADVSVATVSRALRGHASVSQSTRDRVLEAASSLEYVLPFRSESQSKSRTLRVAVLVPHIGRWYYSLVLEGIESVVADRDGEVIVIRPFDKQNRRRNLVDLLDSNDINCAIMVSLPVLDSEVLGLRERGIGLSLLGTLHESVPSVRIDDVEAAMQLTRHFIDLGHSQIGLISSAPFMPTPVQVANDRKLGFRKALELAGISPDPALELETDFSIKGAAHTVERFFSLENPPTAIVAESDELAFGVMAAARSHGLAVPGDLSVGGIDDHPISEVWGLTTIAQPVTSMGEVAAWQAISSSETYSSVVIPTRLIVRSSSARHYFD